MHMGFRAAALLATAWMATGAVAQADEVADAHLRTVGEYLSLIHI